MIEMTKRGLDAPDVRIIPPLVYVIGLVVGLLVSVWLPTKVVSDALAWSLGGFLFVCGAALAGSAVLRFLSEGTTVRPDRAPATFVIAGPYKITRNPMYVGLAIAYVGIAIADQSLWALILLPVVLAIINRAVIAREELFLSRRFGSDYLAYQKRVRRWL
jgi:protein-S-isoprenylcysteine O-methyltransferase Ste14